ncbi:hypothetical protein GUITHDRAFT_104150 [Guillardia theta CCMP2712]|uniref:Protein-serine/threonine kinase n=1 Tax=Guillardia theta (strain CCMP2712) TaxID=905079 RepID=L1JQ95_GUITC|nr:hypothetical protein GUITHDRAFT_104150 [Guillardia theta CCMP2712]EKX50340.1 hypothetical protein GUITHDRAFT_104150 [Guillardia theta CCMP2712]|eukprot:XP_005837320.1 hypothetical protein GUITHDRAFT_104150 [Guillardia theta CCMP2712]
MGNTCKRCFSVEGAETEEDEHEILFFSLRHAATVTLKEMHQFGAQANNKRALLLAAQFLHEELPIRLARRVRELKKLPFGLGETAAMTQVRKLYEKSFFQIRRTPTPKTLEIEENFTQVLDRMMSEHNNVQATVARGLQELLTREGDFAMHQRGIISREHIPGSIASFDFGQFLDRFYLSRVGMRVLVGQHIMLHHPQDGFIGIIQTECQPAFVCSHAIQDAQHICQLSYGVAPNVQMEGSIDMKLPYIPEHLHYIFFELLKNSMRADELPPVSVVFAEGDEDIAIKISDKGGGISRSGMERLWTYSFTTAGKTREKLHQLEHDDKPVMAGFAHGLPLSRIHARAFGGDLQVMSMQGHGTDVYIYLWKLGDREVSVP